MSAIAGMAEMAGVLAALLSSALGGLAIGATRYVHGVIDPIALGSLRFGIGCLLLLPLAWRSSGTWPARRDWAATLGLGLLFFALFPILFNASLLYTTAARGALALSTLPVLTMGLGALLGVERLSARKSLGVGVAMLGVAIALGVDHGAAGADAWRGDALMVGAALCMALYSIGSRAVIARSGPLTFTAMAMAAGALCLVALSWARGAYAPLAQFGAPQWLAVGYLGVFGGAIVFFLWSFALQRTTPTLVAVSVTVNPVAAALFGAWLLDEPIRWQLVAGLVAVLGGILIAVSGQSSAGAGRAASARPASR